MNKYTLNKHHFIYLEKELVLEIERLKRKSGPAGAAKKGKIPSKLDAFVRSVEEERNYYRDQAEAFQKMLRGEIPSRSRSPPRSKPSSPSASPARDASPAKADKKVQSFLTRCRWLAFCFYKSYTPNFENNAAYCSQVVFWLVGHSSIHLPVTHTFTPINYKTWVKAFRIIPEFRILRLAFHRKLASKC